MVCLQRNALSINLIAIEKIINSKYTINSNNIICDDNEPLTLFFKSSECIILLGI